MDYENTRISGTECPFCTGRSARKLYSVGPRQAASTFVTPRIDRTIHDALVETIGRLWECNECVIVRCEECEGVYAWPHVGGDATFYELAYAHRYGYPKLRWEFDASINWLKDRHVRRDGAVLELGAGNGAFQRKLLRVGFSATKMYAAEYSEHGRREIAALDTNISVLSSVDSLRAGDTGEIAPLNYVFAFQVLEHLSQPLDYLKMFWNLLIPGGRVLISAPNPARIEFNETHGLLLDMPPNHVSRFSQAAIQALSGRAGFVVEHHDSEPFHFWDAFKEYVSYRYHERARRENTFESWSQANLPKSLAQVSAVALASRTALSDMPGRSDGGSSLYVLRKSSNPV